jgi:hypothetical protein
MDLTDAADREEWRRHLGGLFTGRKVVVGIGPLAGLTELVGILRKAGAEKPLLVATGRGAGPVPGPDEAWVVDLGVESAPTMTEELRRHDRLARRLPDAVRARIDDYDPAHDALWCSGPFILSRPIDGRPVVGGRAASWASLEDKLLADEIWDAVGQPRPERRVVEVEPALLAEACAEVDRGDGVVWSGDARDGFNGGGEFVRWVTDAREQREAFAFFAPRCDRVRVAPFLDGVPCSIHGVVLPDGTAAFRPVELAILRGEDRRFVYGGQGTFWDPDPAERGRMRALVRRTGEHLRERVGYRGGFGIDGVITSDGFRPTELNPRMSGGLASLGRGVDAGLFMLLQLNLAVGRDPCVGVADLEGWALTAIDERRFGKLLAISDRRVVDDSQVLPLAWDGAELRRSDADSELQLTIGPGVSGTFAKVDLTSDFAAGERVAPLNAALMRFLDRELGTGFGPVTAPEEAQVRRDVVPQ